MGTVSFSFTAHAAGTETVTVTAPAGGVRAAKAKAIVFASGRKAFAKAGRATIKVRLTARGRRLARRARSLTVTVKSGFAPRTGKPVSATKKLKLGRARR